MRLLTILVFALMLSQLGCARPAAETEANEDAAERHNADIQAVRELEQNFYNAEIVGDFEAWLNFFTEDAIVMEPNRPVLTNRAAIRQRNAPFFEEFNLHEESDSREIEVAGNWGYIRAHWTWMLTPKDGGNVVKDTGNSIWIVRKQPDGAWKIARGIFNSENPRPEDG